MPLLRLLLGRPRLPGKGLRVLAVNAAVLGQDVRLNDKSRMTKKVAAMVETRRVRDPAKGADGSQFELAFSMPCTVQGRHGERE